MGFNSAFKGLKLFKNPGNGRLNNLNDPVLNALTTSDEVSGIQSLKSASSKLLCTCFETMYVYYLPL